MSIDSLRRRHHDIVALHGLPATCAYCGCRQIVYVLEELPACVCCDCWLVLTRAGITPIDSRFKTASRKNSQAISPVSP